MKMSIVAFERFFSHLIRGLIDDLGSEALSEDILACFLGALFSWVFHCCGHLCSWILFIGWALRSRRFLLRVWVHPFCFGLRQVHCPFASSLVRHIWPPPKLSPMFLLASQVHPPLCMGVMQIWLPLPHPFPVNPHHLISLILCPRFIPMHLSLTPPLTHFLYHLPYPSRDPSSSLRFTTFLPLCHSHPSLHTPNFLIPMHVATFSLSTLYHIPIFVHAHHTNFLPWDRKSVV